MDPTALPVPDSSATTSFDLGGVLNGAISAVQSVAGAYLGYQQAALGVQQQSAAIDLQKTIGNAQVSIAQAQAQAAVAVAQRTAQATVQGYSSGVGQAVAQMSGVMGGNGNLMLWLTVAGVALAIMQYKKGRG